MFAWQDRDAVADASSAFRRGFLDDQLLDVVQARDAQALDASIQTFMSEAGFERYGLIVIHDDYSSATSGVTLTGLNNTPAAFLTEWEDVDAGRHDPVMRQARHSSTPIVYGQDTYREAGSIAKWERQAPFGYASGICSTFHLPGNLHVFFGIDSACPLPKRREDLARLVARTHYFGTFAHAAALSLLDIADQRPPSRVRLSRREQECLKWAAEGKTAWETGAILSISERSVAKLMAATIHKLDCSSKAQAVAKAIRLGLIH